MLIWRSTSWSFCCFSLRVSIVISSSFCMDCDRRRKRWGAAFFIQDFDYDVYGAILDGIEKWQQYHWKQEYWSWGRQDINFFKKTVFCHSAINKERSVCLRRSQHFSVSVRSSLECYSSQYLWIKSTVFWSWSSRFVAGLAQLCRGALSTNQEPPDQIRFDWSKIPGAVVCFQNISCPSQLV